LRGHRETKDKRVR
jgi:hypothetical protein